MLFEVILRQAFLQKNILNRWFYNGTGTPASVDLSFALISALGGIPDEITAAFPAGSLMEAVALIQSDQLVYVELSAEALYDVTDFYSVPYPPSQNALMAGDPLSPFDAYAIQSNRVRTDIRRGNKRFAGVTENNVENGGTLTAAMLPEVQHLADVMGDTLTYDDEGNTLTFQPAILSFEKHAPDADHDEDWYSKYSTNALQLDHAALGISWTAKPAKTTQNTRKR